MARIEFSRRVASVESPYAVARLVFDERQKVRNLIMTTAGEAVGVFIERGTSLKHGDHLASQDGLVLCIDAAPEPVSVVRGANSRALTRAAYHLGNRHVRLEIGSGYVAYQTDHVLDAMIRNLGFDLVTEQRAFEPEPGAYAHSDHAHSDHLHADHVHAHDSGAFLP